MRVKCVDGGVEYESKGGDVGVEYESKVCGWWGGVKQWENQNDKHKIDDQSSAEQQQQINYIKYVITFP